MSGLEAFYSIAKAQKDGSEVPVGATGSLINFELTSLVTEVNNATARHKAGAKYKSPISVTTDFLRFVGGCLEGRARLGMIIACSAAPSNR